MREHALRVIVVLWRRSVRRRFRQNLQIACGLRGTLLSECAVNRKNERCKRKNFPASETGKRLSLQRMKADDDENLPGFDERMRFRLRSGYRKDRWKRRGTNLPARNQKGQPGAPETVPQPSRLEGQLDDFTLPPACCKMMAKS